MHKLTLLVLVLDQLLFQQHLRHFEGVAPFDPGNPLNQLHGDPLFGLQVT